MLPKRIIRARLIEKIPDNLNSKIEKNQSKRKIKLLVKIKFR
jgi:hypothetical protein